MITTPNDSLQPHETYVDDDVQLLSETPEKMLAYSGDKTEKYVELKTRAQQALDDVKTRVSQAPRPTPTI